MATANLDSNQTGKITGESVLVIRDVHKSFGTEHVLDGINLTVVRGETLAVLGRSGTGKSVLLKLIIGLENPDGGSIRIRGEEIAGLGLNEMNRLRIMMGFLFQHAALYDSLTVEQNVAFPLVRHSKMSESERSDRVKELLATVGMENHLDKMPSNISGGMQKRVGLARALALQPEILLLDEPTAGLDPITSREIDDLVLKLQKEHDLTSVVITHDLQSAKIIADQLALLDKGKVAMEGTFEELSKSNDVFVQEFFKRDSLGANMSRTARLGAFIIAALTILVSGIFMIGGKRYLFTPTYRLNAQFASVVGLESGAEVRVGGVRAGSVRTLELPSRPTDKIMVRMDLDRSTRNIIKQDSIATIETEGLLGSQYVAISFGSAKGTDVADGSTIASQPPLEMAALFNKANGILDSSQEALKNVTHATANLSSISTKINNGQGTIGSLINDKKIYT